MGGETYARSCSLGCVSGTGTPGHWKTLLMGVVYDRKIENFIRTKYDSKRWIMDGPVPDPSTLDTGDDDVVGSRSLPGYTIPTRIN